jgi:hypothetical protein
MRTHITLHGCEIDLKRTALAISDVARSVVEAEQNGGDSVLSDSVPRLLILQRVLLWAMEDDPQETTAGD